MPFYNRKNVAKSETRMGKLETSSHRNGIRHAIFGTDGNKYVGEWKNDMKNGRGMQLYINKELNQAEFKDNVRHGFGIIARCSTENTFKLVYRGSFQNGKKDGHGRMYYKNGNFYTGKFSKGKRNGYGQMWYADGSFYDGDWLDGVRNGKGILVKKDGNRYEGNWEHDQKHGRGRFYFLTTGQIQEGVWKNDIPCVSTISDIPYRQTCIMPTLFPIPKNCLADIDKVLEIRANEVLQDLQESCFHVEPKNFGENV